MITENISDDHDLCEPWLERAELTCLAFGFSVENIDEPVENERIN